MTAAQTQQRSHDRPLGLLLSANVAQVHGARIDALALTVGLPLRQWIAPTAPGVDVEFDLSWIDCAFFSRELYEGSSLRQPGVLSDAFFALVDRAPSLRWLHVYSTGLDLPQYRACLRRGVHVTGSNWVTAMSPSGNSA